MTLYDAVIGPFAEFAFMRRALAGCVALSAGAAIMGSEERGRCNLTHVLVAEAIGTRAQSALSSSIVPQRTSIHRQAELYGFFRLEIITPARWRFPLSSGIRCHHSTCDA